MEYQPKRPQGGSAPEHRTFRTNANYTTVTKDGEFITKNHSVSNGKQHRSVNVSRNVKRPTKKINSKVVAAVLGIILIVLVIFFGVDAVRPDKVRATAVSTYAGVKISWQEVKNADKYEIYKRSNDQWVFIKETDKLSFVDKNVLNGQECNYRIRSFVGKKHSGYRKVDHTHIGAINIIETEVSKDSITLKWQGLDGAKSYDIYRGVNGGEVAKYKRVDAVSTTFVDTDIEENVLYTYAIAQVSHNGYGPMPKEKTAVSLNTKLKKVDVRNSPSGVQISWEGEVQLATAFRISRKTENGKWKKVADVNPSEKKFTDPSPKYGRKTRYKISPVFAENAVGEGKNTKVIYPVDPSKKLVALTYDDGPYSPVTNVILDVMEQYNSRCTFFCVANRIPSYSSSVKRASEMGCEIASHTYEHKYFDTLTEKEIQFQVSKASEVIQQYSGNEVTLLRPPGGKSKDTIPYPEIMWSVDTKDWANRNRDQTLANAKAGIFDGSIVLMHDLYPTSAEATKELVPWLIERGYQIVTVDEMFEARGIEMKNGVNYFQARKAS